MNLVLLGRRTRLRIPKRLTADRTVYTHSRSWSYARLPSHLLSSIRINSPPLKLQRVFNTSTGWQSSGQYWWNWWQRFSARVVKSVNRRCLLCAGAIFLWDKERVTNQEISKSLSMYERRINGKIRSLKESIDSSVDEEVTNNPLAKPNSSSTDNNIKHGADAVPSDSKSVDPTLSGEDIANSEKHVNKEEKESNKPKLKRSYRKTPRKQQKKPAKAMKKQQPKEDESKIAENEPQIDDTSTYSKNTQKEEMNTITQKALSDNSIHIADGGDDNTDPMEGWMLMSEQSHCKVYSKPYGSEGLAQYKAVGYYSDITARDFLDVQVGDCRMSWDSYCLSLKTVDHDSCTGSEVIHWVVKFPFPMSDRDYVFVRRHWISPNDDTVVVISRSVDHPAVPVTRKYIRVKTFFSELVLKPVTFIDEVGFHFELTYFDDPGSNIPSTAMTWATKSALPDFLNKIYQAVLRKQAVNRHKQHLT